jgi:hypothetical protein
VLREAPPSRWAGCSFQAARHDILFSSLKELWIGMCTHVISSAASGVICGLSLPSIYRTFFRILGFDKQMFSTRLVCSFHRFITKRISDPAFNSDEVTSQISTTAMLEILNYRKLNKSS